jgi:predicted PilT family ATPase
MIETLITEIQTACEAIPNIQEVYSYPLQDDPREYPAIIVYPTGVQNSFETNQENFKIYTFSMFVVVNIAGATTQQVYQTILPKTFDDVMQYFDTNWNLNTIDGHRVWAKVSANTFGLSIEQKNKTAFVDMTLEIKALTNN